MSSQVSPAFASARSHASGLPCNIMCGSTPAMPKPRKRPRGSRPSCDAFGSDATSTAAAPSTICDELPAVTTPSGMNAGCSEAIFSSVVSRRTASSTAKRVLTSVAVAAVAVGRRHVEVDRDDLLLEAPLVDRARGAHVRLVRVAVELLARQLPLLRDLLGGDALHDDVVALVHEIGHRAAVRAHRDARHHLDAAGDDEVELARPDRRRGVEVRLHRGAALAVDGRAADGHGPAGGQRDVAADVPRLLVDLADAAPLQVLDLARVDVVARDEAVHDLGRELVAADVRERAVLPPDRAADGVDDERVGGHNSSRIRRSFVPWTRKSAPPKRIPLFAGLSATSWPWSPASRTSSTSLPARR